MMSINIDLEHLNQTRIRLEDTVSEQLNKMGLFYRISSRIKKRDSISKKLKMGNYENEKKIQDVIGIRINLFFYEDMNICENLMESMFKAVLGWEKIEHSDENFGAQKNNHVFRIPSKYLDSIGEYTWENQPLDTTFEIQIRTILFEGWHEIEHDMRYKERYRQDENNMWYNNEKLSRMLNSILASLELCDWTMVDIFDKLAKDKIEHKQWEHAVRSKYRLRVADYPLDSEVVKILNEDEQLSKQIFAVSKKELLAKLREQIEVKTLTPDRVVYFLNEAGPGNLEIKSILSTNVNFDLRKKFARPEIKPLTPHQLMKLNVYLDEEGLGDDTLQKAADIIYSWAYEHMKNIFIGIPDKLDNESNIKFKGIGNELYVKLSQGGSFFEMNMLHISNTTIGEMWNTKVKIFKNDNGLCCKIENICHSVTDDLHSYSAPRFVKALNSQIGLIDDDIKLLRNENELEVTDSVAGVIDVIDNHCRSLPVIVIIMENENVVYEKWNGCSINAVYTARALKEIAHIFVVTQDASEHLRIRYNITDNTVAGGVCVFWPGESAFKFYENKEIVSSVFEEYKFQSAEGDDYEKAFRQRLVNDIKRANMQTD